MKFLVVSLNPAIDAEWMVDDVVWQEKNVVHTMRRWAGGKGVNVARALTSAGATAELLIALGGSAGRELGELIRREGLRARVIPVAEETRTNVAVTTDDGRQTRFNQPGARMTKNEWAAAVAAVQKASRRETVVILSGSLPPGAPVTGYAEVIDVAQRAGARVFLDCDGPTLKAALRKRPNLVKPNKHELSQWIGHSLDTRDAVAEAAGKMSGVTRGWVLVSLGGEGAMLVNAAEDYCAFRPAPKIKVRTTLGAGDAALAAAALGLVKGDRPDAWLRAAVAAGTAACKGAPAQALKLASVRLRSR